MTIHLRNWAHAIAAVFALAVASTPVLAASWSLRGDATPAPRRETLWGVPRDDPAIAIGAIIVALLVFVGIAWVASRIGDKC